MGLLGNIWNAGKKAVTDVGHFAGKVASNPIVTAGAGLLGGPLVGAAVGGLGRLIAPGGNIGEAAKGAAIGGAAGYGGGLLRKAIGGGMPSGSVPGDGAPAENGGGGWMGALGSAGGFLRDKLGGLVGGAGGLASGLTGGGGGGGISPAILALAAAQGVNAASLGQKSNEFSDKAFNFANDSYASRAGLRSAGMQGMLHPQKRDMSGLAAIRAQNPVQGRLRSAVQPQVS